MKYLIQNFVIWVAVIHFIGISSVAAEPVLRSEKIVIVKPGETLFEIVKREMRSPFYWPSIARYNNIVDPKKLKIGQIVRIPRPYSLSLESAIVLFVKGNADRLPATDDTKIGILRGDEIHVGDEIFTGQNGFVSVEFSSGSIINIHPNSHVSVVDIDCKLDVQECIIELYSDSGDVQSRVKKRSDQPTKFLITTPSGIAAVRGTDFDLDVRESESITGVISGQVDMSSSGELVEVKKGFAVVVKKGEAPSDPTPLLPSPTLYGSITRVSIKDWIHWEKMEQASSYQITLSKDKNTNKIVSQLKVADTSLQHSLTNTGDYFITARAIDQFGIKGWLKTAPIKIVSVTAGELPQLAGEFFNGNALFSIAEVVNGATGYEIQISESQEFIEIVGVDVKADESASVPITPGVTLWARVRAIYGDFEVGEYSEVKSLSSR